MPTDVCVLTFDSRTIAERDDNIEDLFVPTEYSGYFHTASRSPNNPGKWAGDTFFGRLTEMEGKSSKVICLWPHSSKWLSQNLKSRGHNSEDPIFLSLSDNTVGAEVTEFTSQDLLGCAWPRKQKIPFLSSFSGFLDSTCSISLMSWKWKDVSGLLWALNASVVCVNDFYLQPTSAATWLNEQFILIRWLANGELRIIRLVILL